VISRLVPRDDGALLEGLLADEGVCLIGVEVSGSTRIVTTLVEGRVTVINEPGPVLKAATRDAYLVGGVYPARAEALLGHTGATVTGATR